jgi:hypothetical protein
MALSPFVRANGRTTIDQNQRGLFVSARSVPNKKAEAISFQPKNTNHFDQLVNVPGNDRALIHGAAGFSIHSIEDFPSRREFLSR